jgi:hypothetical protein
MKILENLKRLFKRRTSITHVQRYSGIDDMLLFNWLKCLEGKLNYTRINANEHDEITQEDLDSWNKIYDNYLDIYGLNDLAQRLMKLQIKLAKAKNDYIIRSNKFQFNVIRIVESEIEKLKSLTNKGITTESVLVHLSRYQGYQITVKTITVRGYFDLLKEYERAN